MRTRLRLAGALLLIGASASPGLLGAQSAAAAAPALLPSGGCWSYTPAGQALDAPPGKDLAGVAAGWTTLEDGGFALETSGPTTVGSERTLTARIASGPVISADADVEGTAYFLLSVDDAPLDEPVAVEFSAKAGAPVEALEATTVQPIEQAGAHEVRLDGVYLDAPGASLRVACNGQQEATADGANPATEPEPTDLLARFAAATTASATISGIEGQAVLDSARTGDTINVELAGLASETPVSVQLCDVTGACTAVGSLVTDAEGGGTASVIMPAGIPAGAGTLEFDDGSTQAAAPLTVLDVQIVAAAEELTADSTIITLTGTGWDPERPVTIRGYAGTDSSTDPTSDPQVDAEVDAAGEFTAEYEVADADTQSVIVDQARTASAIGSVYLISGVIGGGGTPGGDPTDGPTDEPTSNPTDEPTASPTDSPTTAPTSAPVTVPPVEAPGAGDVGAEDPGDIPLPGEVPVDDVVGEEPASEEPAVELSVSEARLDGNATLGEMFGGAPQRDLLFLVENVGQDVVENPIVRVAVGRSQELEPQIVAVQVGTLDPGDQAVVTVPLELPMAAFGTYRVVGQVGDDATMGGFDLEWSTYPWGLFVLNGLGALLLAWGIRHRLLANKPTGYRPALAQTGEDDAIVDLTAAEAWWSYRARGGVPAAPAQAGAAAFAAAAAKAVEERAADEAIVDLDAAEKWWARRAQSRSQVS